MPDAGAAREQAREILAQKRFRADNLPRPLKKPLDWLGDRLDSIGRWFSHRVDDIDRWLPGGRWLVWLLLGAVVAVLASLLARSVIRRRGVAAYGRGAGAAEAVVDPAALEAAALEAERAGEFERAVRLRFEAGVVRLDAGSQTTGEIGAALGSPVFDGLGLAHDAIAYGGREAVVGDAAAAREGWPRVVEGAT